MSFFGSSRKKEKTLEELARDFNIKILSDSEEKDLPPGRYEKTKVIVSDYTIEEARKHLFIDAKNWGALSITDPGEPREKQVGIAPKKTIYTYESRAYKPYPSPAA